MPGLVTSRLFGCLSAGGLLTTCADQYSDEYLIKGPCTSPEFSVCAALSGYPCPVNFSGLSLQAPRLHYGPRSLRHGLDIPSKQEAGATAGLTSFVHLFSVSDTQCFRNYCFIYFVCVLVASGKRINLLLATPSWLEVEGLLLKL